MIEDFFACSTNLELVELHDIDELLAVGGLHVGLQILSLIHDVAAFHHVHAAPELGNGLALAGRSLQAVYTESKEPPRQLSNSLQRNIAL